MEEKNRRMQREEDRQTRQSSRTKEEEQEEEEKAMWSRTKNKEGRKEVEEGRKEGVSEKKWRSGEQREINNRAKCEDHSHCCSAHTVENRASARERAGERARE